MVPLKRVIIFESRSDFCDNSRELFEYMLSAGLNRRYKMVWLVERIDDFRDIKIMNVRFINLIPKTFIEKISNLYYLSVASFAFYSHRTPHIKLDRGEIFVNLWHGAGPKKPASIDLGYNFDYVIYSSDIFMEAFVKYFNCRSEQLLPLGNPRNDLLFKDTYSLKKITDGNYDKVIIWMPTFRISNIEKSGQFYKEQVLPIIDSDEKLKKLDDMLNKYNILLIIKSHPMEDLAALDLENRNNIMLLTNRDLDNRKIKLYSLIKETDALITDISSVYVDYLMLDKPIGFTVNDVIGRNNFLFEDPLSFMPGMHIKSFSDYISFIYSIIRGKDEYSDQRKKVNDLLNKYQDGMFSKRITEYFKIN